MDPALTHSVNIRRVVLGATMVELLREEFAVVKVVTVESAVKEVNIILKRSISSEKYFNPLSPKIDQHQISPCNILMNYKTGWL